MLSPGHSLKVSIATSDALPHFLSFAAVSRIDPRTLCESKRTRSDLSGLSPISFSQIKPPKAKDPLTSCKVLSPRCSKSCPREGHHRRRLWDPGLRGAVPCLIAQQSRTFGLGAWESPSGRLLEDSRRPSGRIFCESKGPVRRAREVARGGVQRGRAERTLAASSLIALRTRGSARA